MIPSALIYSVVATSLLSRTQAFACRSHSALSAAGCRQRSGTAPSTRRINVSQNDDTDVTPLSQQQQAGQAKRLLEKSIRREDRISVLQDMVRSGTVLSSNERKELDGLLKVDSVYEEQYNVEDFTDAHVEWKAAHNDVFVRLARHCQDNRAPTLPKLINVFYLDGPDAATTAALKTAGFHPQQCYIANRHASTCSTLRSHLPHENVLHASAADALKRPSKKHLGSDSDIGTNIDESELESFDDVAFNAFYFDGCGGYTPLIVEMMKTAFDSGHDKPTPPIAVGFSILGGNRNVVDKEQHVVRELVAMVKQYDLRVDHVFDDPERYGLSSDPLCKVEGGTLTTWCILETDRR